MPEALVKRPKLENDCSPQLASRKDDNTAVSYNDCIIIIIICFVAS